MTLYRKYRSQKLSELVGQPQVSEMLGQAITTNRIAHAYLFAGPRGTGKTSVARILAKAINCLADDKNVELPCNQCQNCQAINKGAFLDVTEIDAASNRRVEEARDLIEQVHAVPSIGRYKVFILDEVHMLTNEAFNTLLKTLEEPPAHVVFILCTTESHKVPITVASRCQRFVFARANHQQLKQLLRSIADKEDIQIDDDALGLLSQLADGGYRDGVMLLDQLIAAHREQKQSKTISRAAIEQQLGLASLPLTQQIIEHVLSGQANQAIASIEQFVAGGGEVRYLHMDLIEQLRLLLLSMLGSETSKQEIDQSQQDWFTAQQQRTNVSAVTSLLKRLIAAQQQRTSAEHTALNLEMAIIESSSALPSISSTQPAATFKPAPKSPPVVMKVPSSPPASSVADQTHPEPTVGAELEPEPIPEPPPMPVEPPADLAEAWQRVLVEVIKQNRSVGALLQHHCTPLSHDGTILMLQFWNAFHKKQVEVDKNRILVERVAESVFGQPVKLRGELADKSLRPKKRPMSEEDLHNVAEPNNDLTEAAAEIFGGEFVD